MTEAHRTSEKRTKRTKRIKSAKAYANEWDSGGWCELSWYKENIKCGTAAFPVRVLRESDYQELLRRCR